MGFNSEFKGLSPVLVPLNPLQTQENWQVFWLMRNEPKGIVMCSIIILLLVITVMMI